MPPPPITTHKKPCSPTTPPPPPGTPPSPSGSVAWSPITPDWTHVPNDTPPEKVQKIDDDRETDAPGEPSERAGSTSATSPLPTNVKDEEEEQGEAADSKDEDTAGEDPGHQSDPEAEQNEWEQIMGTVRALWAKEEAKLEGLSPEARLIAEAKVECLKLARQLLQLHLTQKPDGVEIAAATGIVDDAKEILAPLHILRRWSICRPKASPALMPSSKGLLWCTTAAKKREAGCQRALRSLKGPGTYKTLKALLRPPRALKAGS